MDRARGKIGWNRNEHIFFVCPSVLPASGPKKISKREKKKKTGHQDHLLSLELNEARNWIK